MAAAAQTNGPVAQRTMIAKMERPVVLAGATMVYVYAECAVVETVETVPTDIIVKAGLAKVSEETSS